MLNAELYGFYGVSVWVADTAWPRQRLEANKLVKFERYAEFRAVRRVHGRWPDRARAPLPRSDQQTGSGRWPPGQAGTGRPAITASPARRQPHRQAVTAGSRQGPRPACHRRTAAHHLITTTTGTQPNSAGS